MSHETDTRTATGSERDAVWPVLAVATAATFWTVTAEMLPSGLMPQMSADLGVSPARIGLLVSAWALTVAVSALVLVRLTVGLDRARLLILSLGVTALATLLTAGAPGYGVTLVGRVLGAAAHGMFWALVASLVPPARLGRALALVLSGPTLAGLLALPLAAGLAPAVGWRAVVAGVAVMLGLTTVLLARVLRGRPGPPAEAGHGRWDRSGRSVLALAGAGGLVIVAHFVAFTYVTTLVRDGSGLGAGAIPAVLLVLGVTGSLGVAVSGVVSDRFPRIAAVTTAAMLPLGLGVVALAGSRPAPFLVGTVLWGLAVGAFPAVLQAGVLRRSSAAFRSLAGGVVVTVLNLGVAAGATIGGVGVVHGPVVLAALAAGVSALGVGALLVVVGSTPRGR